VPHLKVTTEHTEATEKDEEQNTSGERKLIKAVALAFACKFSP
jgi:hypothetical protein